MGMYDDILLPVDGSEGAGEVLHHAAELAHRMDATVRLLHVADTSDHSVSVIQDEVVDGLVRQGEQLVADAGETLDTLGVEYATDVVQGHPAATIAEYAETYDYDLIVMPTQGRQGVSRYLLGSVTEKVVRLSSVPVLTARMRTDDTFQFPYERVLVPTDGSETATRAAHHALDLAATSDATVHVLSVVEAGLLGPNVDTVGTRHEEAAGEFVEDVLEAAESRDLDVVTHVEHGRPVEEILGVIDDHDVHAVVMGTTGRRGVDRILLGSVAEKTVRSAPVPVVTVPGASGRAGR